MKQANVTHPTLTHTSLSIYVLAAMLMQFILSYVILPVGDLLQLLDFLRDKVHFCNPLS